MAISVYLGVDWDKDGTFTDESSRLKPGLRVRRGRPNILNPIYGFELFTAGEVWATLRNFDRRFDPFNTSSPITNLPTRPVKITVTQGATTYPVFAGWTKDVRPIGQLAGEANLRALDGLHWLDTQKLTTTSNVNNVTAKYTIDTILAQASKWAFPGAVNSIEDNGDLHTAWNADGNDSCLFGIHETSLAWAGKFFVARDGGYTYLSRSNTTVTAVVLTGSNIGRELEFQSPGDEVYNEVRIYCPWTSTTRTMSDTASQDAYGTRTIAYGQAQNNGNIYTNAQADALADYILDYSKLVKKVLRVKLVNRFTEQFSIEVGDVLTVNVPDYDINNLYQVGEIFHDFGSRGNCETTLRLEPYYNEVVTGSSYPLTFDFDLLW